MRREKVIGSSLEAEVWMPFDKIDFDFEEILISAAVHKGEWKVTKTTHHKCGRCWRHLPEVTEDGALCGRCEEVVNG
jgi:isoleucyl-tRNA synthetase